jgi:hypothetical protein
MIGVNGGCAGGGGGWAGGGVKTVGRDPPALRTACADAELAMSHPPAAIAATTRSLIPPLYRACREPTIRRLGGHGRSIKGHTYSARMITGRIAGIDEGRLLGCARRGRRDPRVADALTAST